MRAPPTTTMIPPMIPPITASIFKLHIKLYVSQYSGRKAFIFTFLKNTFSSPDCQHWFSQKGQYKIIHVIHRKILV